MSTLEQYLKDKEPISLLDDLEELLYVTPKEVEEYQWPTLDT